MTSGSDAMPCHEAMGMVADAAEAPPCPHCSHGQSGWGCGHCAGCLLGAALGLQAPAAAPLIEPGQGDWTQAPPPSLCGLPVRVPTPPPKDFARC